MKPNDPARVSPELLNHLASFESRGGLLRMNARMSLRRLTSKWAVAGAGIVKRGVDVLGSSAALLLLSPILTAAAILVRLDGGPVIFVQTRVGRHGRPFKMFKFRSMRIDAEKRLAELLAANKHDGGVTFKIKNDPRVTRIGRWLRRYSIDELPQFYNVLIGDMSLVGPRPPVPREVALYTLADRRRLFVKPGITCIWQISGRAEIDFPGQVLLDVGYIESQSLRKDIKILAGTPKAIVFGPGAY
jgi:lipopolysaccharide/colanic/teichoic acid biosynthesis glycosyltransferase